MSTCRCLSFLIFPTELPRYEEGSTLAGIIYVHRISDKRFDRIAGLDINMSLELFCEPRLKNFVLITNAWSEVTRDIGEAHENKISGETFRDILRKGAQMVRHDNTTQSAHDIIRRIMGNRSAASRIQQEDVANIAALEAENRELDEHIGQYQGELARVREELKQMDMKLKEKDEGMTRVLDEMDEMLRSLNNQGEEMTRMSREMEKMARALDEKDEELMQVLKEKDKMELELEEYRRNPLRGLFGRGR